MKGEWILTFGGWFRRKHPPVMPSDEVRQASHGVANSATKLQSTARLITRRVNAIEDFAHEIGLPRWEPPTGGGTSDVSGMEGTR